MCKFEKTTQTISPFLTRVWREFAAVWPSPGFMDLFSVGHLFLVAQWLCLERAAYPSLLVIRPSSWVAVVSLCVETLRTYIGKVLMPWTCFFCILEWWFPSSLIISAVVVPGRRSSFCRTSTELWPDSNPERGCGQSSGFTRKIPCTVKAFPWEDRTGSCHPILPVGNTLTHKEVEDWVKIKSIYI